ncbi:MAG: response regulator transcription factor, partial [Anaerolineales bacterium]|nr:response regulator transcription factor [Anaerolineales bacterium]
MLLNAQPDIKVVGEAADGEEAIRLTEHLRPDLVLLDLTMPGLGGLEALKRIKAAHPDVQVLVLTMHDDEGYLRSA